MHLLHPASVGNRWRTIDLINAWWYQRYTGTDKQWTVNGRNLHHQLSDCI